MGRPHPEKKPEPVKETQPELVSFGVGLSFKVDMAADALRMVWTEKVGSLDFIPKGENLYWTRVDVQATDETEATNKAWALLGEFLSPIEVDPLRAEIVSRDKPEIPPAPATPDGAESP